MTTDVTEQLVEQAKSGDVDAFETLCRLILPDLEAYLWSRVGVRNTIDDLVQDSVLALYRNLERMASYEHVRAFLFRVARNQTYDLFRQEKRRETVPFDNDWMANDSQTLEDRVHWIMLYDRVQSAIEALPLMQREALQMHYEQRLKYSEIALLLDIPEGTVKTRVYQARKNLMRSLPSDILASLLEDN